MRGFARCWAALAFPRGNVCRSVATRSCRCGPRKRVSPSIRSLTPRRRPDAVKMKPHAALRRWAFSFPLRPLCGHQGRGIARVYATDWTLSVLCGTLIRPGARRADLRGPPDRPATRGGSPGATDSSTDHRRQSPDARRAQGVAQGTGRPAGRRRRRRLGPSRDCYSVS